MNYWEGELAGSGYREKGYCEQVTRGYHEGWEDPIVSVGVWWCVYPDSLKPAVSAVAAV